MCTQCGDEGQIHGWEKPMLVNPDDGDESDE